MRRCCSKSSCSAFSSPPRGEWARVSAAPIGPKPASRCAMLAVAALIALFKVMAWEEWVNVALGVWLAVSPWLLGFNGVIPAMWNAVIGGILVAVLALWALGTDKDIGGWWSPAT